MTNGIVLGGALNCRESTSKDSKSLGRFSTGDVVSVSSSSDADWYQTTMNGTVGYVMKAYVAVANDTVKVNASNVNVRDGSSTSGTNVLYQLSSPTTATVLSVTQNWVQIQPSGKSSGWIHAKYVNRSAGGASSGGDSGTGSESDSGSTTSAPALATIRNGEAYLKVGHSGTAVTTLRSLLKAHNYACNATGAYDEALKAVVKTYQTDNGITADGLAGQVTFALLEDNVSDTGWFSGKGTCQLTAGKLVRIGFTGKKVLRPDNVARLNQAINDSRFNFTEKIHIRHFLAQGCKETDKGKTFTEYTYHAGWTKEQYNGSPSYAPYCGGGFLQLTHYYNYKAFSDYIGDANVLEYDYAATQYVADNYPFLSAAWYWCIHRNINKTIDNYSNRSADATVKEVTRLVKGDSSGYSVRLTYYENAKNVLK